MVDQNILLHHIQKIISIYKPYLSSTLRYERYMIDETPKEWVSLLGPDVCLLTHADVTAKITHEFVSFNAKKGLSLTDAEMMKMRIAPLIHDWGEIIIEGEGIGDITYEQKSADHEIVESVIFYKVVGSIKERKIKEKLQKIYLEVVMDRQSILGDMFNAIERLGYMQTALRAYTLEKHKRIQNWKGLVGNVLSNQIPKLLLYTQKYPYVTYFLTKNKNEITKSVDETDSKRVPLDNKGVPTFDYTRLSQAYSAWKTSHFYK